MARILPIKVLRTTRANLNASASAVGLLGGEPYLITDESRLAVGLTTSTYMDFAKLSEVQAKANSASPTFTGTVTLGASVVGGASLNIPQGTAPTSPVNGDVWTTALGVNARIGGVTLGLSSLVMAATNPTPIDNMFWWDSTTGNLRIRYNDGSSSQWVDAFSGVATTAITANTLVSARTITMTGDVTWSVSFDGSTGVTAAGTIAVAAVTNTKLAQMANGTIKGRTTAGAGSPEDLTGAQATALLSTFTSAVKGLVPASGGGTTNFMRADGTWAAPPAGGSSSYTVTSQATSYTEAATSGEVIRKITASGQTVTLPTAVGNTAKLTYKFMVAGTCVIDGAGTETIDEGLTATLTRQYESITLVSDNANWIII